MDEVKIVKISMEVDMRDLGHGIELIGIYFSSRQEIYLRNQELMRLLEAVAKSRGLTLSRRTTSKISDTNISDFTGEL